VYSQDPSTGSGQVFPNRPIRIITSLPGGGSDATSRLIAQASAPLLGQPVIVENRPSNVTGEVAMKAQPDGYTLLVDSNSFWTTPLMQKTPYDVLRDFSPVTIAATGPNLIVVHPTVAATSIRELIALAKSKPGQLNYAASLGSTPHLAMEMFKSMAGISIVHVPYKGSGQAVLAVLAGECQVMSTSAASVTPHIKSGKLRALAVTSAQPSALFPALPTMASSGFPGYDLSTLNGVFASGAPPRTVINRLNRDIARALHSPELKEKFLNNGTETVGSTPEEFTAKIKSEVVRLGKVVKDANIKIE